MPTKDEYIEKLNLTPHPWPAVTSTLQFTLFWMGARHRICIGYFMMNYGISMMAHQSSSTAFIRMVPMRPYI